jgi:hypothetical protein
LAVLQPMRYLRYLSAALLTFAISAIVHLTLGDAPYRFHFAALTGDLATVE